MSWNKHLTELCIKCPLHIKYVLAPYFGKFEVTDWQVEPSTQYLYVHFNESLNSHNNDWELSQKLSYLWQVISSLHYMREMPAFSLDLGCQRTETTHQERVNSLNHAVQWTWGWRRGASVYVLASEIKADIWNIRCKDDVTYYMFKINICMSIAFGSICHSNFPK